MTLVYKDLTSGLILKLDSLSVVEFRGETVKVTSKELEVVILNYLTDRDGDPFKESIHTPSK